MFDIGFLELLLLGVVGLLVLGPERLPTAVRTVGLWVGKLRRSINRIQTEIDHELRADELRKRIREEAEAIGGKEARESITAAQEEAKQFEHLVERQVEQDKASS